ncbi:DUF3551 domain-containing protein [Bradyrhizobium sediminis]|uniref:DUF3551 domain-containing protein n=1 Tax=Bradyrhizobium sediminis TaxID=2840469 RepID=A0A975NJS7_9BRAD|nr:DUF3551 domain-containing protein [Bradyrhizobium sediminis]QWG16458.1 DUF3551 domain-containing protein [Bradyrhizobium sediminis]
MRKFFLAAVAVGTMVSIDMTPSPVQARDYLFCIKGDIYDSPVGDCSFDTYEQCLATASGRLAYCDVNPFYAYPNRGYPKKPGVTDPRKRNRLH